MILPGSFGILLLSSVPALAAAQSTVRVSVDSSGAQVSGASVTCSISLDGRFVAFMSDASDLVPGDTNGQTDVFVHDRVTGQTTRASVDSTGAEGAGGSAYPSISGDGRRVAFRSSSILVANDTNMKSDAYVHDLSTGTTTRVSVASSGAQADLESGLCWISADGRYVAFESLATNLVTGDTNAHWDVFVHDMLLGATVRASVSSSGAQAGHQSFNPSMSADGRFVAFWSYAPNLVAGDTNGAFDVFVRDLATGQTTRASVGPNGVQGNGSSGPGTISADGRWVVFASAATNFFPGDVQFQDVFVRDLLTGQTTHETPAMGGGPANESSFAETISSDGRFIAFESLASDLVAGDTNGGWDVFVRDRQTGTTVRASVATSGAQGDFGSVAPYSGAISGDGRAVAFRSAATNLVAGDTNNQMDIFVRDAGSEAGVVYCSGDGSATACPCGNSGSAWHGCAHSASVAGARLTSSGTASVSSDSFLLSGASLPPGVSTLYFQGTAATSAGAGSVFGDGLRCVGGIVHRLGIETSAGGSSSYGAPAGDTPVSVRGAIPAGGGTFHYQAWFRNAAPFCAPSTYNLTNGLRIVWAP